MQERNEAFREHKERKQKAFHQFQRKTRRAEASKIFSDMYYIKGNDTILISII